MQSRSTAKSSVFQPPLSGIQKPAKRLTSSDESQEIHPQEDEEYVDYILVAAIDFGTTFSGYAFSFTASPENIRMNKNWGENLGFQVTLYFYTEHD